MKKQALAMAVSGLFMVASILPAAINAGEYWGEYCWEAVAPDDSIREMKFAVTHIGDSHFLLAGTFGAAGSPHPANGNAELIGTNIEITLVWSYYDETFVYDRVAHVVLDTVLQGSIRMIKTKVNLETGQASHGRGVRTVTPVSCE